MFLLGTFFLAFSKKGAALCSRWALSYRRAYTVVLEPRTLYSATDYVAAPGGARVIAKRCYGERGNAEPHHMRDTRNKPSTRRDDTCDHGLSRRKPLRTKPLTS